MRETTRSERARVIASLSEAEAEALLHDWEAWARPSQQYPPGAWSVWLALAGRGWGKTRVGAETVRRWVMQDGRRRIALVGRTAADVRDVMVEGESGILAVSPPKERPVYEPSKRRLTWPNGAMATTYSADRPDQLRGPQHDAAWADELAAWQYADAWDQLQFGLRLGGDPRCIVTTTPRPTPLVRALAADPSTHVTRGSTYENKRNLAAQFLREVERRYAGTRLGRQELDGEILEDRLGALWTGAVIDAGRYHGIPELRRVVVAVDPAVSSHAGSDETGIVVAGLGRDGDLYVLADLSGIYTPGEWARAVADAYTAHHADIVVVEVNQGGDLVEANLRNSGHRNLPIVKVHATRGKVLRAEPVHALYERGIVHHVGFLADLEQQMTDWVPAEDSRSPDRVDALVYALTELAALAGTTLTRTPSRATMAHGARSLRGQAVRPPRGM